MVGAGTIVTFFSVQAYLIDAFTLYAASGVISASLISSVCMLTHFMITTALAAVSFMRSLAGFGFPLFAPTMYNVLGYGKGDTILAAAAIALGCPAYVNSIFLHSRIRSNLDAQTVVTLVLWRADTKCQPFCSQRQLGNNWICFTDDKIRVRRRKIIFMS